MKMKKSTPPPPSPSLKIKYCMLALVVIISFCLLNLTQFRALRLYRKFDSSVFIIDQQQHLLLRHPTKSASSLSSIDQLIHNAEHESLRILLNFTKHYNPPPPALNSENVGDPPTTFMNEIEETEQLLCQRFGFEYDPRQQRRRRIFYGSLIADDSWHVIATHAIETYGLYHTAAFIESNATLSDNNLEFREPRFGPDSTNFKALSSIFGPTTKVSVDFYVDNPAERDNNRVIVEDLQREKILERWRINGMTVNDIGIIGDVDEFFSRDFLVAAQVCDVPEFRLEEQDCRDPKLFARTKIFELTPECSPVDDWIWFHPDMIIGECIDTIGDSTIHKPGKRQFNGNGRRIPGYGGDYNYTLYTNNTTANNNNTMFPLWKPLDFRSQEGGRIVERKRENNSKFVGFHLHNFFSSINELRNKYKTYGHAVKKANDLPLGKIHEDILFAVNCVTGRPDVMDYRERIAGGFEAMGEVTPIVFQKLPNYRSARHNEVRSMILEDEVLFER